MRKTSVDRKHWARVAGEWITWARSPNHDAFWAYRKSLITFVGTGDGDHRHGARPGRGSVHVAYPRRGGGEGTGADLPAHQETLAAAKARGVQLGDPERGRKNAAKADAYADSLREVVTPLAGKTTREIAGILNAQRIPTARGSLWQSPQVMRLKARLGLG